VKRTSFFAALSGLLVAPVLPAAAIGSPAPESLDDCVTLESHFRVGLNHLRGMEHIQFRVRPPICRSSRVFSLFASSHDVDEKSVGSTYACVEVDLSAYGRDHKLMIVALQKQAESLGVLMRERVARFDVTIAPFPAETQAVHADVKRKFAEMMPAFLRAIA
jgi:hypothetical protein